MSKTILITGSTDGIGLGTAKALLNQGHRVLLHGRNPDKLHKLRESLAKDLGSTKAGLMEYFLADLSNLDEVANLAAAVLAKHSKVDVLINNAGVFKTARPVDNSGMDVRFIVNTIAPYLLTQRLLPIIPVDGRIINLSSAAQSEVDLKALEGGIPLSDNQAYAQSKLALTTWSIGLANTLPDGPAVIAVNPASLIGTNMVKDAFGIDGSDLQIGVDILVRAALSDEFDNASGRYYDNDNKCFAPPHAEAMDVGMQSRLLSLLEKLIA